MSDGLAKLKSGYQANLNGLLLKEKTLHEDLEKTQEAIHQFRGAIQAIDQAMQLPPDAPPPPPPMAPDAASEAPPNELDPLQKKSDTSH